MQAHLPFLSRGKKLMRDFNSHQNYWTTVFSRPGWECAGCGGREYLLSVDDRDIVQIVCTNPFCAFRGRWTALELHRQTEISDLIGRLRRGQTIDQTAGIHPTDDPDCGSDPLNRIVCDATDSLRKGANVGVASRTPDFCIAVLNELLPEDIPSFVLEHPIVRRAKPVVASLVVMFLSTYFRSSLPFSDRAYWIAKTALEVDGRDTVHPMLARVAAMFQERLRDFTIPE